MTGKNGCGCGLRVSLGQRVMGEPVEKGCQKQQAAGEEERRNGLWSDGDSLTEKLKSEIGIPAGASEIGKLGQASEKAAGKIPFPSSANDPESRLAGGVLSHSVST